MSIYGPPSPPPRDHARRASARLTRLVLAVLVLVTLTGVGVYASLEFVRHASSGRLEVDRDVALEIDRRRSSARLPTADLLPLLREPPLELPAPLELTPPALPERPPFEHPALLERTPPPALPEPAEPGP